MDAEIRPQKADGIEEYDNALPKWWVWLFNFTILFSIVYMVWLHMFGGETIEQEYARKLAAIESQQVATTQSGTDGQPEGTKASGDKLMAAINDSGAVDAGKAAYMTNCLPCHGAAGEGTVGPNLTDNFWIHGGSPQAIAKTIAEGVLEKGMPAWKPVLGETKVNQLTAFVVSLKGTNPANGKAPQGDAE